MSSDDLEDPFADPAPKLFACVERVRAPRCACAMPAAAGRGAAPGRGHTARAPTRQARLRARELRAAGDKKGAEAALDSVGLASDEPVRRRHRARPCRRPRPPALTRGPAGGRRRASSTASRWCPSPLRCSRRTNSIRPTRRGPAVLGGDGRAAAAPDGRVRASAGADRVAHRQCQGDLAGREGARRRGLHARQAQPALPGHERAQPGPGHAQAGRVGPDDAGEAAARRARARGRAGGADADALAAAAAALGDDAGPAEPHGRLARPAAGGAHRVRPALALRWEGEGAAPGWGGRAGRGRPAAGRGRVACRARRAAA